jgi:hypothetical protein
MKGTVIAMRSYITSLLAFCISIIALAVATSTLSRAADEATRIEIDQKTQVIRFVIDGHERALLDAAGLHVRDDITYGGIVKDVGADGHAATEGGGVHAQ